MIHFVTRMRNTIFPPVNKTNVSRTYLFRKEERKEGWRKEGREGERMEASEHARKAEGKESGYKKKKKNGRKTHEEGRDQAGKKCRK